MAQPDLKATVFSQAHAEVGTLDLDPGVFTAPLRRGLIADVVRMQTASRRAGTAATKEKGEVRGGGKKPWRQKGTGRARAGSIRSPLWQGGGTTFGPHPRDYSYRMSKQARRAALKSALAQKLHEERLTILDKIELEEAKTKHFVAMLKALGIDDTVLVVIDGPDGSIERSARNLPSVKVLRAMGLNVYDLLRYHQLVMTSAAVDAVTKRVMA